MFEYSKCGSYKGVKIYRRYEIIHDFAIKNGQVKEKKPTKKLIGYSFMGGYPYDSKEELYTSIDKILAQSEDIPVSVEVLNSL